VHGAERRGELEDVAEGELHVGGPAAMRAEDAEHPVAS
jgi:hypothetical protein